MRITRIDRLWRRVGSFFPNSLELYRGHGIYAFWGIWVLFFALGRVSVSVVDVLGRVGFLDWEHIPMVWERESEVEIDI